MPYDKVMSKFKSGKLHSGSSTGPAVKSRKQAVAIMLSEKRAAEGGKKEYMSKSAKKKNRSVMGRQVIHHSPDKHPESTDAMAQQPTGLDLMLQRADEGKTSGTYGGMRKDLMPAQQPSSEPAKLLEKLRKRIGG